MAMAPARAPSAAARRRRSVDRQIVGVLALVAGSGWFAQEIGILRISWDTLLAVVLVVLGVAMALTARARHGLMLTIIGITLTLNLAGSTNVDFDQFVLAGDSVFHPTTVAELPHGGYQLGFGEMTIDLSDLEILEGETAEVRADLIAGELRVIVPSDETVALEVNADVKAGEARVLGEEMKGVKRTLRSAAGNGSSERRLVLHLSVAFGQVEVDQPLTLNGRSLDTPDVPEPPEAPFRELEGAQDR